MRKTLNKQPISNYYLKTSVKNVSYIFISCSLLSIKVIKFIIMCWLLMILYHNITYNLQVTTDIKKYLYHNNVIKKNDAWSN